MTFAEAKALICRINPDSNDPLVQCAITICRAQAEALKAHWCIGGADEASPPNPAIAGRCRISENMAAQLDPIGADVAFLVNDRKGKIERNRKRGAENQAKGIDEDRERAAKDMDTALDRVRRRIADAEKNGKRVIVLDACRAVCKEFKWKTKKKNALGKCADGYYPLTGADGKPIKPETLAKNYRDRYGGKRGNRKKAVAVK